MTHARRHRRLLIAILLLLVGAVIGIGLAFPGDHDAAPAVNPYDPMPRW